MAVGVMVVLKVLVAPKPLPVGLPVHKYVVIAPLPWVAVGLSVFAEFKHAKPAVGMLLMVGPVAFTLPDTDLTVVVLVAVQLLASFAVIV